MRKIMLLNGPNLNRLGKREPEIYGQTTLNELEKSMERVAGTQGYDLLALQSNIEGEIINFLHRAEDEGISGVILNPGAYTHYSYGIRDAIASISVPVIEVHISNIHKREQFRHQSVTAPETIGQIVGLGLYGYELALLALVDQLKGVEKK
jgi:3-dehydroquinate dehydratase II